jgi:hypothetical protein
MVVTHRSCSVLSILFCRISRTTTGTVALIEAVYFSFLGWSETKSTITAAITGLLHQPRMMMDDNEWGAFDGMLGKGNRSTRRKPVPVPFCPPQIPRNLIRDRTRAAAVGSRRLTTWAAARPIGAVSSIKGTCSVVGIRSSFLFHLTWYSWTWGTQNPGGTRRHLTGYVTLKNNILLPDKHWIIGTKFRVGHRRPERKE